MKSWKKWTLRILAVLALALAVVTIIFWPSIRILSGTGGLSGELSGIPTASSELTDITKGDADWISWLGAEGDNKSRVTGISEDWSSGLTKLWDVSYLCQGKSSATWSAPVIQGNRLVVSGRMEDNDLIFCLDPLDGSLLWTQSYTVKSNASHGAGPRATPYIDDDRVYTFGRSGDLQCLALFDGKELWRKNVTNEGGLAPQWGYASSPLVIGDKVIVQGGAAAGLIAFDKMSGKAVWKSPNDMAGYAAIRSMELSGETAVLNFHGKGIAAVSVENGTELWNVPWETSYDVNATTPLVVDDSIFVTSGYKTGGGLLDVTSSNAKVRWKNEAISSHHSDSYCIDGYLYGYTGDSAQNKGAFKCVRLADGEEQWTTNEMGWGTCSYVDGYLLCMNIKGNIFLMKPDPKEFIKITEMEKALGDIKGPVWTKPVIANGHLYLRFKQNLVCYKLAQ